MALLGASPSAGAAHSSAGGEDGEARASLVRSSSRGQLRHLGEESAPVAALPLEWSALDAAPGAAKARGVSPCHAMIMPPSSPPAPPVPVSSSPSDVVLDQVANEPSQ